MPSTKQFASNRSRQWAAWLYTLITAGRRRRLREQCMQSGRYPIAVLFYHRVADNYPTPWTLSRRNFIQHLDWLEENFDIVSLSEAQRRIHSSHNTKPTVAITFDDGYSENCDFAIPELVRRRLPATYFVVSENVLSGRPFDHDLACHKALRPNSVAEIRDIHRAGIEIGGHTRHHLDIGQLTHINEVAEEILGGIAQLEDWGVGPVRYFSFPFGLPENTSQVAVDLLYSANIAGFCTAYGAWNWPGSLGRHLRRIHADPGMQTLKSWLTLDPRKMQDKWRLPFHEPIHSSLVSLPPMTAAYSALSPTV